MAFSIIVAAASNQVIGNKNQLIWHLPSDLKRFKAITMGHHVIMGRNTFESMGRALPGRTNVVITHNKHFSAPDCVVVKSIEEAAEVAKNDNEPFVIGGGQIYNLALPLTDKIYLTRIHQAFDGDVYFPELATQEWELSHREDINNDPAVDYKYSYLDFRRIKQGI